MCCLAAAVFLLGVAASGCGSRPTQLVLPPPVHVQPAAAVGWWFFTRTHSPELCCDTIHVFRSGGQLRMALDRVSAPSRPLEVEGDKFISAPTVSDPRRMELWVSNDGRLEFATVENDVTLNQGAFQRGTQSQIRNVITSENVELLENGIAAWLQRTGSLPSVAQMRPGAGAFAKTVRPWPTNPFTGSAMSPGDHKGDFSYHYNTALWSLHWIDAYGHEEISESSY